MKVHFDMDGVLADLDGSLAADAGLLVSEIRQDRCLRRTLIDQRRTRLGTEHYTSLQPLRLAAFRALFVELATNDISVHILTAGDVLKASDATTAFEGKQAWARRHYGDLIDDGTICGVYVVATGEEKARLAGGPGGILVDDEPLNTIFWRGAGGDVIDYQTDNHDACIKALRSMLDE